MGIIQSLFLFLRALIMGRAVPAVENLALRQQVAVLKQSVTRPKLRLRGVAFPTHPTGDYLAVPHSRTSITNLQSSAAA